MDICSANLTIKTIEMEIKTGNLIENKILFHSYYTVFIKVYSKKYDTQPFILFIMNYIHRCTYHAEPPAILFIL